MVCKSYATTSNQYVVCSFNHWNIQFIYLTIKDDKVSFPSYNSAYLYKIHVQEWPSDCREPQSQHNSKQIK